jgi:hypothetical protein
MNATLMALTALSLLIGATPVAAKDYGRRDRDYSWRDYDCRRYNRLTDRHGVVVITLVDFTRANSDTTMHGGVDAECRLFESLVLPNFQPRRIDDTKLVDHDDGRPRPPMKGFK